MLVNLSQIMKLAEHGRYAVGGFNITSLETAFGIIAAAEQENSPVILQISEKTIDYMSLEVVFAAAKALADRSKVPVAIHFDHGRNYDLVWRSIEIGFTSVMLDVSKMEKTQRIPFVKDFAKRAHRRNVTVEVEEDVIGGQEDYVEGKFWKFTDPTRAAVFAKETLCDLFAVSIGNSHGQPLADETFDLTLLAAIDKAVEVPLVLHGASSTEPKLIREAISHGVRKINIDTDLRQAFSSSLRSVIKDEKLYDPRDLLRPTIGAVQEVVVAKIRLFGSNGKA